ncbi:MAG: divergent polysaccharide deacetylase family protein, partial [Methyloceanibacter sp.]|nr:divergent polysaccharide deacetylase family protein [Methyloceanibacter sp.]
MKALAVAAGIVFWTLVLGTAWLAFFPGSDGGEPVAILQIEPARAPGADMPAGATDEAPPPEASEAPAPTQPTPPEQAAKDGMELPPGFGVPSEAPQAPFVQPGTSLLPMDPAGQSAPPPAAPSAPDDAAPPDEDPDQQGAAPAAPPEMQQAALDAPAPTDAPAPPMPETETGSIVLPPVPVAEMVEESQYGPLPKVATDGRRPVEVYARPSRYAAVAGAGGPPRIAILVTGLGLPDSPPGDVLNGLPPTISVAYGAYGRNLQDGVTKARDSGHEVLLQIPLEPNNYPTEDPGPHTLLTSLPPEENMKRLQWLMSRYTGYVG